MKNVINEKTRICLIGDSITQGLGSTGFIMYSVTENGTEISVRGNGPEYSDADKNYKVGKFLWEHDTRRWYEALSGRGWAHLLKDFLESRFHCTVKNYGMSGINSADLFCFIDELTADFDTVLLTIGTNDRGGTKEAFYSNLKKCVEQLKAAGKEVILMANIPASASYENHCRFHMEDVASIVSKVSDETNVTFISLYDSFIKYCESTNTELDSLLQDGLHPNDDGYLVMFHIICQGMCL